MPDGCDARTPVGSQRDFTLQDGKLVGLAPALGEHTDQVLREFGLDDAELAALRAGKVI